MNIFLKWSKNKEYLLLPENKLAVCPFNSLGSLFTNTMIEKSNKTDLIDISFPQVEKILPLLDLAVIVSLSNKK